MCRIKALHPIWLILLLAVLLASCNSEAAEERREEPETPSNLDGAALYNANCRSCHGGADGGRMMDIPPPDNENGHTWHHPDCQLKEIILSGSGEMGEMMREMMGEPTDTPRMPAFKGKLSDAEVEAILAHIKTWWTEEQRAMQAEVTEARC